MMAQTVGKYRIVSRLGGGGMGTVYRAVDETLGREVAIKSLNPGLSDPDLLKRFRAEAVTLAKLNHPNIATLFELTQHEDALVMVMEFVRGETLEALSQRSGPLPADRCREMCSQVLDALAYAHRAGIVHRDLKPANLMLTESGLVKVMDFGLARMAGTEHLTTDGFMVGTPAYMAPEQVLAGEVDGRADLYAMGVVLFRLLTAQLPFKADSGIAMAHKHVHDAPTPVRHVRVELQQAYENIIGRALSKSPADRFQTAEEFKAALVTSTGGARDTAIAVPSLPPGPGLSSWRSAAAPGSAAVPVVPDPATVMMDSRAVRPKKISAAAALAGALVIVGLPSIVYVVMQSRASTSTASFQSAATPPASPPAPVPAPSGAAPTAAAVPAAVTIASHRATHVSVSPAISASAAAPLASKSVSAAPVRGDTSLGAAPAPPLATPSIASVKFEQLKMLRLSEDKPRDHAVSVALGVDALDVMDGSALVERARYHDVIGLFQSHSREPRWTKPDGTAVPLAKLGGRFGFLRGASDWVTVRTQGVFIPLHVPESEVARLISELEIRTGTKVVRTR